MSDEEKKYDSLWDFFDKSAGDKQARCLICSNVYCYKSTSHNLKAHLLKKHPNESKNLPPSRPCNVTQIYKPNRKMLWGYFSKLEGKDKIASCNLCDRVLSYKSTNTNLRTHLKRAHTDAYERLNENLPPELDENCEEVYLELEDDSIHSVSKLSTEIWSYFEQEGSERARCVVCRQVVSHKTRVMKEHLRVHHSKLLAELPQDTDDESENNEDNNDNDIYTEVVYLDENLDSLKKDDRGPITLKTPDKIKIPPKKKKWSAKKRKDSSSDEEVLAKKKKSEDNDEEIENFGNYITCLLKKMPRDVSLKLQMDIVNLVMNTKLKISQSSNQINTSNETIIDNRVILEPVTLQTITPVTGTSYIMAVPNKINNSNRESLITKALNTSLSERDRCSSTVPSVDNTVEVSTKGSTPMSNTITSTDTSPGSVRNTFASHGYSFTIATSLSDNDKAN